MDRIRRFVLASLIVSSALSCGGQSEPAPAGAESTPSAASPLPPDIAANSASTAYFHEQLVTNGEDVQTDFGSALLTLGMNPRDLQQDTPDHAYTTAKQKLDDVKDEALKRDLTRALFGPTR